MIQKPPTHHAPAAPKLINKKCKQLLIYVTALLKMLSAQCSEHLVDDVALLRFIGVHIQIERCRYVGVS